jgi:hypothetical protein
MQLVMLIRPVFHALSFPRACKQLRGIKHFFLIARGIGGNWSHIVEELHTAIFEIFIELVLLLAWGCYWFYSVSLTV